MPTCRIKIFRKKVLYQSALFVLAILSGAYAAFLWISVSRGQSGAVPLAWILTGLALLQLSGLLLANVVRFSEKLLFASFLNASAALLIVSLALGEHFGLHHLYLGLAVVPVLSFERQSRLRFWLALLVPGVLYFGIEGLGYSRVTPLELDSGLAEWIRAFFIAARLLLMGIVFLYFAKQGRSAQARINLAVSELRESDRTSRALLAAFPDMIFRISDEGRFLDYHCPDIRDLFLPPEKWVGKKLDEVLPFTIAAQLFERVSQAIQGAALAAHDSSFLPPARADIFTFEWEREGILYFYDVRFAGTGASDALMVVQDVSERVRNERIILEQRAKSVTENKMAALGEMAGGIAHEINNPLAIIYGKVQELQEMEQGGELTQEKLHEGMLRIEQTVMRISKLVRSLRLFARDGQEDPLEYCALHDVVEDTLEFCRERFRNHQIDLRLKVIAEDFKVECRPLQIGQVLLNLLNNAHDAVEGLVQKWIELTVDRVGERVLISVIDSGGGIPVDLRMKIMQPFFTTKGVGKGTGLGLSISKGIVEAHQGALVLDPDSVHTRFVVDLPMRQCF